MYDPEGLPVPGRVVDLVDAPSTVTRCPASSPSIAITTRRQLRYW
jgi:hypothetical protein